MSKDPTLPSPARPRPRRGQLIGFLLLGPLMASTLGVLASAVILTGSLGSVVADTPELFANLDPDARQAMSPDMMGAVMAILIFALLAGASTAFPILAIWGVLAWSIWHVFTPRRPFWLAMMVAPASAWLGFAVANGVLVIPGQDAGWMIAVMVAVGAIAGLMQGYVVAAAYEREEG